MIVVNSSNTNTQGGRNLLVNPRKRCAPRTRNKKNPTAAVATKPVDCQRVRKKSLSNARVSLRAIMAPKGDAFVPIQAKPTDPIEDAMLSDIPILPAATDPR